MDVYVMGVVYCPMNRAEQDSDICNACKHFDGHKIERISGRLYIKCLSEGRGAVVYEDSAERRITVADGERLPPTENDAWKTVRIPR